LVRSKSDDQVQRMGMNEDEAGLMTLVVSGDEAGTELQSSTSLPVGGQPAVWQLAAKQGSSLFDLDVSSSSSLSSTSPSPMKRPAKQLASQAVGRGANKPAPVRTTRASAASARTPAISFSKHGHFLRSRPGSPRQ
jgi:hypothetical protein